MRSCSAPPLPDFHLPPCSERRRRAATRPTHRIGPDFRFHLSPIFMSCEIRAARLIIIINLFPPCCLAMTASAAASAAFAAAPSHLSKTNTDTLCCDPAEGYIRRFVYRVNLWSGAYMLERHERICLYSAVGLFFVSSCIYTLLFASGFVDGWKDSSADFLLL